MWLHRMGLRGFCSVQLGDLIYVKQGLQGLHTVVSNLSGRLDYLQLSIEEMNSACT